MIRKNPFRNWKTDVISQDAVIDEVRGLIAFAGGERHWSDTRESWLRRAAHRLGIDPGRATSLFYRKVRRLPADEYLTIRARAQSLAQADLETAIHAQIAELAALATDRLVAMGVAAGAGAVGLGERAGAAADRGEVTR